MPLQYLILQIVLAEELAVTKEALSELMKERSAQVERIQWELEAYQEEIRRNKQDADKQRRRYMAEVSRIQAFAGRRMHGYVSDKCVFLSHHTSWSLQYILRRATYCYHVYIAILATEQLVNNDSGGGNNCEDTAKTLP